MAKTLEAHDNLIREIFEGSHQFEIPDYQRPYAWTPALLIGRQKRLVNMLSAHWNLAVGADDGVTDSAATAAVGGLAS